MGVPLAEIINAIPGPQRRAVKRRARALLAEQMTLVQFRKAAGATQVELARKLGKPQAAISRVENQSDMLLSTLSETVAALGGRLSIVAELPGQPPVRLAGFGDLVAPRPAAKPGAPRRQRATKVTDPAAKPPNPGAATR